jgi:hypothetical protein
MLSTWIGAAALALLGGTAIAQPPPPLPGSYPGAPGADTAHRHEGVYVRLFGGVGYTHMSTTAGGYDYALKGTGGSFGVAVGYTVAPNLVVYGELFDDIAMGPTLEINGESAGSSDDDVSAGVVGVGVGAAYYLAGNLYLSGTLAMAQLTAQEDNEEIAESEFGPGASLMVGKEWWVSPEWGLGVAGQLFFGQMKDSEGEDPPTWKTLAGSVAFSATFN